MNKVEKISTNFLWTKYYILKSTLIVNGNTDISRLSRLISFLKIKFKEYVPKKFKVLEAEQVQTFIKDAPDGVYLLHKVVLVMGVFEGLRRDLVRITVDDIEDKGNCLLVKIRVTRVNKHIKKGLRQPLLGKTGASFETLKMHGKWKSASVA
ncbi:hypothetical protein NQ317_017925 [Molorchus minor]|uniref:Uncharacterized protein n=1 Tax=Molorchus minor TaxID=1323400 RepID=A0ABQ9J5F8_9CUCU|nr:hypothetical protein NQ317_017925 [Molorchus minor]